MIFSYLVPENVEIGVYVIRNNINDKLYIGSSNDLKVRFNSHKGSLKRNKHHSKILQRFYNKYQDKNLELYMELIEEVKDASKLIDVEQKWLNFFFPFDVQRGYNIAKIAGSTLGVKRSEKTNEKIQKTFKERYNGHPCLGRPSPLRGIKLKKETREKISKANSGNRNGNFGKHKTEEEKRNLSKKNSKSIVELNSNNKIINEFKSIKNAANYYNIDCSGIIRCCQGEYSLYKNKIFRYSDNIFPYKENRIFYKVIDSNGVILFQGLMCEIASKFNISRHSIRSERYIKEKDIKIIKIIGRRIEKVKSIHVKIAGT